MQIILRNIELLMFMSFGVVGFHRLWLFMTKPGQILGFVDSWSANLMKKETSAEKTKKFWIQFLHKSLGTCAICNRQRFVEIVFTLFIFMTIGQLAWWFYIFFFILFTGVSIYLDVLYSYIDSRINQQKNVLPKKSQKL